MRYLIDKHGGDRRLIEQDLGDGDVVPLSRGFLLKTLKRGMYGRASIELLRARILPLSLLIDHTD